ncbi:efflux RND transporter periplasmic adaptor subunit [Francisella tularensis subsp. novicida]|uniref:efflux RND transporter periplasmic adaptor subunit n=1 Tax=Francisella tularensis TaxID=263 RepID=UPI000158AFD9|nr:efflux RND transporter periplasmic adaptor subunit [Francisella tularensis]AJI44676.1 efflux transporter, RND family, MFP subunit [Francisella tularensis subsp. novicida F6168]AJJ47049.1 efflux transporter, RND family, MFP subunit [Francisella tularensis subsp. novicida]APC99155.1 efflux transporter, RND family, MFP subunit [Francisella tularensis subsp. novicida]EDN36898.1 membrane fusion protein [Francisella tularensis subsp. novicida GA99-3549]KFJ67691.1 efflux transporter, RND family, M
MDVKKTFLNIKQKINSSKRNYAIFVIATIILAWLVLGKLGISLAIVYFIFQINYIKNKLHKLKDKKTASIAIVVATLILFGGIFGFAEFIQSMIKKGMAAYVPQPVAVTSSVVEKTDWKQVINTIGEAQAVQSTAISSQSGGIVSEIHFKSGQEVKKGDLLFKLDTSQLKANLEEALSNLKLAKITKDRYNKLVEQKATSKESADKANADYLSALAQVQNIESQIGFKEIRAPFDGKIGIRNISLGQYFNNGDNAATLTTIAPIFITFPVPQNKVSMISVGQEINFYSDSYPGETFTGKITAINSFINDSNRSITVQATYTNPHHKIVAGMFLTVHVSLPTIKNAIVIPRNAVSYSLYGQSVFTLEPVMKDGQPVKASYTSTADGGMKTINTDKTLYKVGQANIQVIETRNNLALVKGLEAGTIIVTSGQNKVHKGMNAILNNSVKIDNNIYDQGIQ